MPRRKRPRYVQGPPVINLFCPGQSPPWGMDEVVLSVEGFEAIRLCDHEQLDHAGAAERMGVSPATFGRVLSKARSIVAEALVLGRRLRIEGGSYETPSDRWPRCGCPSRRECKKGCSSKKAEP